MRHKWMTLILATSVVVIPTTPVNGAAPDDTESATRPGSIGPIAFGPAGTLFVSDPLTATVFACDVSAHDGPGLGAEDTVADLMTRVGALVGTDADDVRVIDLAACPSTGQVWLSVLRGQGDGAIPLLIRVGAGGALTDVPFADLPSARADLANPATKEMGRRGADGRLESITDIAYVDGKVIVAGLSNEEFASTLRTIDYPFRDAEGKASIEIYHGAHGKLETHAPIRTFLPFEMDSGTHIVAAYTCTPLVLIPVEELQPEAHVRGKTIAELGNRNRPLDMISYEKDGGAHLLMSNSSRGMMKIPADDFDSYESINERVAGGGTVGVPYETLAGLDGVVQLDKLDDGHAVILVAHEDGGDAELKVVTLP